MAVEIVQKKVAGASVREMARKREIVALLVGMIGLLVLGGVNLVNHFNIKRGNIYVVLGCLALLGLVGGPLSAVIDHFKKREKDAIRGAEAEEAVGAILDKLAKQSDRYLVLHDVMAEYGNVDHIVVRKDGVVFMIETKSQRGKVTERDGRLLVSGRSPKKDFMAQAGRNAVWLGKRMEQKLGIPVWVKAGLVFPNAYVGVRREVKGVTGMGQHYLKPWIERQPANAEMGKRMAAAWDQLPTLMTKAE